MRLLITTRAFMSCVHGTSQCPRAHADTAAPIGSMVIELSQTECLLNSGCVCHLVVLESGLTRVTGWSLENAVREV